MPSPSTFQRAAPPVALSTLLMAGCDASDLSIGPPDPAWQIAHGGEFNSDPSFVLLAPMVKNSVVPDAFNPDLSPNIRICEIANAEADPADWECVLDASGNDVLLRESGPSAITVEHDRYSREWKLDDAEGPVEAGNIYRVTVRVGDYFLGYADVAVGSNMREARNLVTGDAIPVNENRTLVIAFHAGQIRCPAGADCSTRGGTGSRRTAASRFEIRYTAVPTGVTGLARSGDLEYRALGAASGVLTPTHQARIVTVADFKVLVTSSPGVTLGRARVAPPLGVLVAFPMAADGTLQDPEIDGVFFAQGECGEPPQVNSAGR